MKNEEWYNKNKIIKIAIKDKTICNKYKYIKPNKTCFIRTDEYIKAFSFRDYKISMEEWLDDYSYRYSIIDGKIYEKSKLIISFDDDYVMRFAFDDEEYDHILSIKNELLFMDSTWFNIFTENDVLKIKYP